jgi:hypothetical protein
VLSDNEGIITAVKEIKKAEQKTKAKAPFLTLYSPSWFAFYS